MAWYGEKQRHSKAALRKRKIKLQTNLYGREILDESEINWVHKGDVGIDREDLADKIIKERNKRTYPYATKKRYTAGSWGTLVGIYFGRRKRKK